MTGKPNISRPTVDRLLGFLEADPNNLCLLADAAQAAWDVPAPALALSLVERYEVLATLPSELRNLRGLAAMAEGRYDQAADELTRLLVDGEDAPELRFNLAWARAMLRDFGGALDLLDDATVGASLRAPTLKIHMMHHLGQYEHALAAGQGLVERFPQDIELAGALAILALDADETELASYYADRAGTDSPEGSTALATLRLNGYEVAEALALFEAVLESTQANPRAWLGKGLGLLAAGDNRGALPCLDNAAQMFGDHLGSWIAAGWAHLLEGDTQTARARFETALALDDRFAEAHGSIAVLDVMAGDDPAAKRRCEIALRLDRNCFSATLARTMRLEASGATDMADTLRRRAMSVPIGGGTRTLAQALIGFGRGNAKR